MPKKSEQAAEMEQLQVGVRIRHARVLKGLRMRDLADKVGYDESMISKIDAGKVMPSLPMLNRIVTALDRDLASFFGLEIDEHKLVQSSRDRLLVAGDALRVGKGVSYERMVPIAAGNLLEANIHIVEPGGEKADAITHQGEATGYLIEGEIELTGETNSARALRREPVGGLRSSYLLFRASARRNRAERYAARSVLYNHQSRGSDRRVDQTS